MKARPRTFIAVLLASTFATLAGGPAMAGNGSVYPSARPPKGRIAWLAAGDSYSSGEGIAGTGVGADTCAQSSLAYGPKSAQILRTQRGWSVAPLAFTACTGSTTHEFYNGSKAANHGAGPQWTQALRKKPPGNRFDVITMSFGGNDLGFADIMSTCVTRYLKDTWIDVVNAGLDPTHCDITTAELHEHIDDLMGGTSTTKAGEHFGPRGGLSLDGLYRQIADQDLTARGVLVVVGYPRLFADPDQWGKWRNGRCNMIMTDDAVVLNEATDYLDSKMRQAVSAAAGASPKRRIVYVSRYDLFHVDDVSHELCSSQTEYVNGVAAGILDGSARLEHSFHPNDIGHSVTAESVAGLLAEMITGPVPAASPAPTAVSPSPREPAPIQDGTLHWNIGETFTADCVVAWPTAPTRTTQYIQMTMTCSGVPSQYMFVNVTYFDPNLAITPSTGTVRIHAKITDMATSEFGFRTLVVLADKVTL